MGCCVYRGNENVNYDLDLYDFSDEKYPRSLQRIAGGNFTINDCVDDIVTLKFAVPVPVMPNVKYALRWVTHEGIVFYGEKGMPSINGPDGTKFDFSSTKVLGYESTTEFRGQIPQILYCHPSKTQVKIFLLHFFHQFMSNPFLALFFHG